MTWHGQDLQPHLKAAAKPEGDGRDRYLDVTADRAGQRSQTAEHGRPGVAAAAEKVPPDPGTVAIRELGKER